MCVLRTDDRRGATVCALRLHFGRCVGQCLRSIGYGEESYCDPRNLVPKEFLSEDLSACDEDRFHSRLDNIQGKLRPMQVTRQFRYRNLEKVRKLGEIKGTVILRHSVDFLAMFTRFSVP